MLNYPQSRDEIKSLFVTRFTNLVTNGLPPIGPLNLTKRGSNEVYIPEIRWQNIEITDNLDNGKHWLRFSLSDTLSRQASMAGGRNQEVGTRYKTFGLCKVELFFSKSSFETADCDNLNFLVSRCFIQENTDCGVWFKNTVIIDLPPEENFFRSNVLSQYRYDTVIK